jgi:hypothetical protein
MANFNVSEFETWASVSLKTSEESTMGVYTAGSPFNIPDSVTFVSKVIFICCGGCGFFIQNGAGTYALENETFFPGNVFSDGGMIATAVVYDAFGPVPLSRNRFWIDTGTAEATFRYYGAGAQFNQFTGDIRLTLMGHWNYFTVGVPNKLSGIGFAGNSAYLAIMANAQGNAWGVAGTLWDSLWSSRLYPYSYAIGFNPGQCGRTYVKFVANIFKFDFIASTFCSEASSEDARVGAITTAETELPNVRLSYVVFAFPGGWRREYNSGLRVEVQVSVWSEANFMTNSFLGVECITSG